MFDIGCKFIFRKSLWACTTSRVAAPSFVTIVQNIPLVSGEKAKTNEATPCTPIVESTKSHLQIHGYQVESVAIDDERY
jgi:hypothetical protein